MCTNHISAVTPPHMVRFTSTSGKYRQCSSSVGGYACCASLCIFSRIKVEVLLMYNCELHTVSKLVHVFYC